MSKGKARKKLFFLLLLVFCVLFSVSAYQVWTLMTQAHKEQQAFEELEQLIADESGSDSEQTKKSKKSKTASAYAALKKRNPDFFGWIRIKGTQLNYPVMYTPEEEEYYLRRNFDGEHSQSGVPFLAASCYEGCGNYLIYGHNMNNGAMFASLLSYADQDYWEQHPTIGFDTLTETGRYKVMAAFYTEAYPKEAVDVFHYDQYTDLSDRSVFAEYVEQVQAAALYDTGVDAAYGDELLTLSTCSYHKENGRFVVVARRKN